MIPLPPHEVLRMWKILKKYTFRSTHGVLLGHDLIDDDVKQRVLESMVIQARASGYTEQAMASWNADTSKEKQDLLRAKRDSIERIGEQTKAIVIQDNSSRADEEQGTAT